MKLKSPWHDQERIKKNIWWFWCLVRFWEAQFWLRIFNLSILLDNKLNCWFSQLLKTTWIAETLLINSFYFVNKVYFIKSLNIWIILISWLNLIFLTLLRFTPHSKKTKKSHRNSSSEQLSLCKDHFRQYICHFEKCSVDTVFFFRYKLNNY